MNLFEIIPQDLFKPLVSKYKEIYFICLQIIYDKCNNEQAFSIEKDVIIDEINKYLNENSIELEDETNLGANLNSQMGASKILRDLEENGITEEYLFPLKGEHK